MPDSPLWKLFTENATGLICCIAVLYIVYRLMLRMIDEQREERKSHAASVSDIVKGFGQGVDKLCNSHSSSSEKNCSIIIDAINNTNKSVLEAIQHHDDKSIHQ